MTTYYEGCDLLGGVCDCTLAGRTCAIDTPKPIVPPSSFGTVRKPFVPDMAQDSVRWAS
jgi:hypothetical protein